MKIDKNGNGKIECEEFINKIQDNSSNDDSPIFKLVNAAFKKFDKNGDGKLDFQEFSAWASTIGKEVEDSSAIFQKFDKNHDGILDLQEFSSLVSEIRVECNSSDEGDSPVNEQSPEKNHCKK